MKEQNYYDILDISITASPDAIRVAYIRAKNTYSRDSVALYSLFDTEQSKQALAQIEQAFDILSDEEKRRKYDESHGLLSTDSFYTPMDMSLMHSGPATSFQEKKPNAYMEARVVETKLDYEPKPVDAPKKEEMPAAIPVTLARSQPSQVANPQMEEQMRTLLQVSGSFLREIREYKKVSPEAMMEFIKIKRTYLQALEGDELEKLPAPVFVRGFVLQYAKSLGLDGEKAAQSYMQFYRSRRPTA